MAYLLVDFEYSLTLGKAAVRDIVTKTDNSIIRIIGRAVHVVIMVMVVEGTQPLVVL